MPRAQAEALVDVSDWRPVPRGLNYPDDPTEQLQMLVSQARSFAAAAYKLVEGWGSSIGDGPVVVLDHLEHLLEDAEHIADRLPHVEPKDMKVLTEKQETSA